MCDDPLQGGSDRVCATGSPVAARRECRLTPRRCDADVGVAGRGDTRHVRAVADGIERRRKSRGSRCVTGVLTGDGVVPVDEVRLKIGILGIDPGVDDGDADAVAVNRKMGSVRRLVSITA